MTTYLGKSCSFCLPRVPFVNSIYVFSYFPFGFEGRIWDLIVSVPDHCLSFYFTFIWMEFITLDNVARTPLHKIISILEFLILFCHQSRVTIRIFLSLLGKLNATPQYAVLGKLHLRQLQMALLVQWKPRILPLCHPISITDQIRRHILWWNKDRFLAIKPNPAAHIIFSYASMYDWGAHLEPKGLLFHGVLCSRPIPTPYLVSTVMIATETLQVCCTSENREEHTHRLFFWK